MTILITGGAADCTPLLIAPTKANSALPRVDDFVAVDNFPEFGVCRIAEISYEDDGIYVRLVAGANFNQWAFYNNLTPIGN